MLARVTVAPHRPHLLSTEDGDNFFLLGDTAWELIHRLDRDQIDLYLATRSRQNFNFFFVNALAETDGLRIPNPYGPAPFEDLDPRRPVEAYFEHLDYAIDRAAENGLYVGLLPAWGDKLTAPWGDGPAVFLLDDLDVVRDYARWLADRYKDRTNIIWVLGGDRPATVLKHQPGTVVDSVVQDKDVDKGLDYTPIWTAFADEIRAATNDKAIITYHPQGGSASTSKFLHTQPWLDFNMMQSGHGAGPDVPVWDWISRDRDFAPAKPTIDGEPNYEDHPVSPWPKWDPARGYFRDHDVRKQMYRAVFAGACGAIYGHHAVWQFYDERYEPINHVDRMWREALTRPGAEQIGHLRRLMESRQPKNRVPDQRLIADGEENEGGHHIRAIRCVRGSHAFIYVPTAGQTFHVNLTAFEGSAFALWFDPITGVTTEIGRFTSTEPVEFVTPAEGVDKVLILENRAD